VLRHGGRERRRRGGGVPGGQRRGESAALSDHSHTRTEPRPSQTDINFAKLWPGVLWIIVGLVDDEPDVRTWRIDDGQVTNAELVVE
jgi:[CysO sulfur-carrier protein]-S-L-cysteine hydrolase